MRIRPHAFRQARNSDPLLTAEAPRGPSAFIDNDAGKLCWGFTGEWDLLPDLHDFAGDIEASFRELF